MAAYNQSKVKMFRRCQKQFAFRYDTKSGKEMVPNVPKLALSRGSWLHELIEAHHRQWAGLKKGANWEAVHERNTQKFNSYFEEDRAELGDLPGEAERIFRSYLRFWRGDSDRYTVARLHDRNAPAIEFLVEHSLSKWGISAPFKGRVDLLVEDHEYDGLWIWDHKWMKTIPPPDERMMSPQALLYVWALRQQGYDIRGFVYNYGRTKPPTVPRVLKRPPGMLSIASKMDTDYNTYLRAIKNQHGDKWKYYAKTYYKQKLLDLKGREKMWFDRQRIPTEPARVREALKEFIVSCRDIERRNKKVPPRSYFYNCRWSCDYHDVCVAQFTGLDIEPLIRSKYQFVSERYAPEEEDLLNA